MAFGSSADADRGKKIKEIKSLVELAASGKKKRNMRIAGISLIIIALVLIAYIVVMFAPVPLVRPGCSNGAKDTGEEGVDCGGSCFKQCFAGTEYQGAEFRSPSFVTDIAVDGADNIYVVDLGRNRLMVYSKSLELLKVLGEKTLAGSNGEKYFVSGGSGNDQFLRPIAVAVTPSRVYVYDEYNSRIQVFNEKLEFVETIAESDYGIEGKFPSMASAGGKLAAAGMSPNVIYLIAGKGSVQQIAGLKRPEGVAFSEGKIYAADTVNQKIKVFDSQGSLLQEFGSAGSAAGSFNYPTGIAVSGGIIAVADSQNNRVQVFDTSFKYIGAIPKDGAPAAAQLKIPTKVAVDSKGRIIVADSGNNRVAIFDSGLNFVQALQGISKSDYKYYYFSPRFVAVSDDGTIFVGESEKSQVTILGSDGKYLGKIGGELGAGDNAFNDPQNMAMDSDGKLYVADTGNNRVQVFDAQQKYTATIGGQRGTGAGQFDSPRAVAVDGKGRVFVTDKRNNRVQVFDSSFGQTAELKSNESFQFESVDPIATDSAGNIFVADPDSRRIAVFSSSLSFVKYLDAGSEMVEMEGGMVVNAKGGLLVVDLIANKVKVIDTLTGAVVKTIGSFGETGEYVFNLPVGLAIAPNGDVFVVDAVNRRIQVYDSELNYKRTIDGGEDWLIETPE